jgi:hypothetical protein
MTDVATESPEGFTKFLSLEEAYTYTGVGRHTFTLHIRPKVPYLKLGRRILYKREDLDSYLRRFDLLKHRVPYKR